MTDVIGFDPVAWSIDGGSHPASLLRRLAYAATHGDEGIITPLDCKVHQLPSAAGKVNIDVGAISMLNRSTGGANQSYLATAAAQSTLDVDPTSGSSRSDLVIVRIEDPQYSPWPDPPSGEAPTYQYTRPYVIKNVPSSTVNAASLALGYSAYALARIDIPSGTTNITDLMIKDLRRMARPHIDPQQFTAIPTNAVGSGQKLTSSSFVAWATAANTNVEIPTWGAQVIIEVLMGGVRADQPGSFGTVRARLGLSSSGFSVVTRDIGYDINPPSTLNQYDRMALVIADTKTVPVQIRGTTQPFGVEGKRLGGAGGDPTATIEVDLNTVISSKLTFKEVAA